MEDGGASRRRTFRRIGVGAAVAGLGAIGVAVAMWPTAGAASVEAPFVRDGNADFVVSQISFLLGPDADRTGACPAGMSKNLSEIFAESPAGRRRPGETDEAYTARLDAGADGLSRAPDGRNYCEHPELAPPDIHFRTMDANHVRAGGLDLDGRDSRAATDAPRIDFVRPDGTRGIDNQYYRAVGCSRSFQSTGLSNSFATEMLTGAWGILIRLQDVDDLRNDGDVTVVISANADPIQLGPTRQPLDFATYAMDQDRAFRATTRGRIVDGVLTTDPVDVQLHHVTNGMFLVRVLKDARIRAGLSPDGRLKGRLGGFAPVEAAYNLQFGFRNGTDDQGQPSPKRTPSANGAARVLGYTCPGIYQALHRLADGRPDPRTGRFTAISTQYHFEAIPAFVVEADTHSANEVPRNGI